MHQNIKLLLLCSIFIHAAQNLLAPLYAIYIKQIGGTLLDAGASIGIYAILKGTLYLILGSWQKIQVSRKTMIFLGYCLFATAYIAYLFATVPWHIFAIQALLAVGETIINPSWSATIAMSLEKGREVNIYSNFYGYRSIFEGLAALGGGYFAMQLGFNTLFVIMTILAFASAILVLFLEE